MVPWWAARATPTRNALHQSPCNAAWLTGRLLACLHNWPSPAAPQAEQTQRERMAELAQLKERVSTVLNAYLSKDMELQTALQEMQAMGIELVPVSQGSDGSGVVEFEVCHHH